MTSCLWVQDLRGYKILMNSSLILSKNRSAFDAEILQISFTAVEPQEAARLTAFIWDRSYVKTLIIIAANSLFVTEPIIPH